MSIPSTVPAVVTASGAIGAPEWEARLRAAGERLRARAPQGGIVAFVASDPVASAELILAAVGADAVVAPMSPRLPTAALRGAAERIRAAWLDDDRPADPAALPPAFLGRGGVVIHTSGSSGEPKAVLLAADSLLAAAAGVSDRVDLRPGDRWLLTLPMHHVSGVGAVLRCALAGASVAVPDPAWTIHRALTEMAATHVSLVATQLYRALNADAASPSRGLRVVMLGGGPTPATLLDDAVSRGWPVVNSYGLTEMGSTVTATEPGAGADERRTAGRPLPGRTVRIVEGEIRVGGAGLFEGYLSDGRLERELDADGLFRTGDLGRLDDAGRLLVDGRADTRFVSGGENVHPEEIETALASLPGVVRAVVIPIGDNEFGQRGVAFVEMADGSAPDAGRLAGALGERIERFKVPVRFHPWPAGHEGLKPSREDLRRRADPL
jgi:O-succinylbenzoic acid--CoA ligase